MFHVLEARGDRDGEERCLECGGPCGRKLCAESAAFFSHMKRRGQSQSGLGVRRAIPSDEPLRSSPPVR